MTKEQTGSNAAPGAAEKGQPKSIVLFSDGTGNSSGKLFKTNVWRMYQAVDLGPSAAGSEDQIAYYDNGVGTSSFKPWAIITGIFGIGLKRNVLSIYRFVCRNYQDEDRIYAFGFSRGAFTIRIAVALLCKEGIIRYDTERELNQRSADALRRFSRANDPNFFPGIARAARLIRDGLVGLKRLVNRAPPQPKASHRPDIEFVGVWDTVAAYGGPFAEVTRGIDNWIWPLSMTDYHLSPKVKQARHALALDDERDSFQPLFWDEFKESRRGDADARAAEAAEDAERKARAAGDEAEASKQQKLKEEARERRKWYETRLQQVWFAGMHSDVGGGYPDDSLSHVSLRWMMDEVGSGLRFHKDAYKQIVAISNSFGPIHDSRRGLGSYYRYQPRKITAFLHPESQAADVDARRRARIVRETLSLRDPTLGEQEYRPQGYLLSCKVHESVIARITSGTDDYAPIVLPDQFEIVPPAPAAAPTKASIYKWQEWKNIEAKGEVDPDTSRSPRGDCQEAIWNDVFLHRWAYFATVAATLLLVSLPLTRLGKPVVTDDRWIWGRVTGALDSVLPEFLDSWIGALRDRPLQFAILLFAILVASAFGARFSGRIKDRTRGLWRASMKAESLEAPKPSPLRRWRNGYRYQRGLQMLKWWVLPNLVFGPFLVLAAFYLLFVLGTQLKLSFDEHSACRSDAGLEPAGPVFRTNELCHATGVRVLKDHEYSVDLYPDVWSDGGRRATPEGLSARSVGLAGWLGIPLRRVVSAGYLEPLYEVRSDVEGRASPLIYIGRLQIEKISDTHYRGRFRARRDGELFLFVNDAVLPWDMSFFYTQSPGANAGMARLVISDLTAAPPVGRPAAAPAD